MEQYKLTALREVSEAGGLPVEVVELLDEYEQLKSRNESLEAAHRDAAEGSAWLQKHLPTKYLGKNIVNAAAAWIRDLQASAESELRFIKSALSRHDHNSLRHDWPREVDSHRRLWVKVPAHFLEELLGISIDD